MCIPKGGGGTHIIYIFFELFIHSFTFILIILTLYKRKFCDGLIILVFLLEEQILNTGLATNTTVETIIIQINIHLIMKEKFCLSVTKI